MLQPLRARPAHDLQRRLSRQAEDPLPALACWSLLAAGWSRTAIARLERAGVVGHHAHHYAADNSMQQSQTSSFRCAMCRRLTVIMFVLVTTAGWGFGPSANLSSDRVVAARQASMLLASVAMPVIADMATGRAAYDPDRALVLSERIASLAATSAELFPTTSSSNTRSRARASLWRDKPAFDADMQQYVRLAATLAGAARDRSLQALRAPALDVAQACRSCHRDYADLD